MVEKPIDAALWPRTPKGVALYALAAVAAIILGIIPALWINHWRAEASEPATPIAAEPIAAPPSQPAVVMPETEAEIEMEPEIEEAAEPARPDKVVVKTTKRARPRPQRTKPAAKKATPTCDIYLYPHGCPK